jgi:outer membrane autotransporter protein
MPHSWYFRSKIDGYTETGAGANNVEFGEQTIRSTQYSFGLQVSRAISLSHGVLAPQFDLSFASESRNSDFAVAAQLLGVDAANAFNVRDDEPDKSYGSLGLGLVYVTANGKQAYISYRTLFGNDTLDRDSLNLGARFDF